SASATGGGGGLDLLGFNGGTGSANINGTTFSNNQATGTASAGGMFLESTLVTTITTSSFTSNSAGNKGGGVFTAGGTLALDGTSRTVSFSGNTATVSASSIGANAPVTVSGNNFTIDGSIDVLTNGTWTDNTGSTFSLTNINVFGTFNNNNSTLNISGNLLVG